MKPLTAAQYAALRGRSPGWVSEQLRLGMPAKGKGRSGAQYKIDPAKAIDWEVAQAKKKAEAKPDSQHERLQIAQAEKLELSNLQKRGELIRFDFVVSWFHAMNADMGARLDAIGGRLANEFPGTPAAAVRQRIRAETDAVRAGHAEYQRMLGASQPTFGIDEAPAATAPDSDAVGRRKSNPAARRKRRTRPVPKQPDAVHSGD